LAADNFVSAVMTAAPATRLTRPHAVRQNYSLATRAIEPRGLVCCWVRSQSASKAFHDGRCGRSRLGENRIDGPLDVAPGFTRRGAQVPQRARCLALGRFERVELSARITAQLANLGAGFGFDLALGLSQGSLHFGDRPFQVLDASLDLAVRGLHLGRYGACELRGAPFGGALLGLGFFSASSSPVVSFERRDR
jgi:hypothetical protein